MGTSRLAISALLGLLLPPAPGASQAVGDWNIIPQAGFFLSPGDIGPVAQVSVARYLDVREVDPKASFGVLVERTLPGEGLALFVRGLYALPTDAIGAFNCLPGLACPALLLESGSEIQTWSGAAGLRYSPLPELSSVRPFLTLGAGLEQNRFSWSDHGTWIDGGSHTETVGVLQFGAGLDVEVGPLPLRLEFLDSWSPEGGEFGMDYPEAGLSSSQPLKRASQHHVTISLGWVLSLG